MLEITYKLKYIWQNNRIDFEWHHWSVSNNKNWSTNHKKFELKTLKIVSNINSNIKHWNIFILQSLIF